MTAQELIKQQEGLVLKPYRCSENKLTIGYGYNMEANPLPQAMADYLKANGRITEQMAEALFIKKFAECNAVAVGAMGPIWLAMNDVRRAVVMSMIYQMGKVGFLNFKQTIAEMKAKNWVKAAYNMLQSKWEDQTEQRAHQNALMMATGEWLVI